MRDEASLRRLAEIGIDVYVLRGSQAAAATTSDASASSATARDPVVVLLADATVAPRLLGDVRRAFAFARVGCRVEAGPDEDALAAADALVAFGDALARAAGACLPATRQQSIGWVVLAEPGGLARDARAKRAMWSELKRILRNLARMDRTRT
jgi:hypothetical protein